MQKQKDKFECAKNGIQISIACVIHSEVIRVQNLPSEPALPVRGCDWLLNGMLNDCLECTDRSSGVARPGLALNLSCTQLDHEL